MTASRSHSHEEAGSCEGRAKDRDQDRRLNRPRMYGRKAVHSDAHRVALRVDVSPLDLDQSMPLSRLR